MKRLIHLLLFVSLPSLAQRQIDISDHFQRADWCRKSQRILAWTLSRDFADALWFISQDTQYRSKKGVQMLPYSEYKLRLRKTNCRKHCRLWSSDALTVTSRWQRQSSACFHIQAVKTSLRFQCEWFWKDLSPETIADGFKRRDHW